MHIFLTILALVAVFLFVTNFISYLTTMVATLMVATMQGAHAIITENKSVLKQTLSVGVHLHAMQICSIYLAAYFLFHW